MRRRLRLLAVATVLVALAAHGSPAWADGDPASDILLHQSVFLPPDAGLSQAQQAELTGLLNAAARAGYPIRVAVIPDSYDLGSITVLWHKPETYARFLGAELSLVYRHPVVVVMPDGVGLKWPGHSTASAQRLVAGLAIKPGSSGLLTAAEAAVRRLLSSAHMHAVAPGTLTAAEANHKNTASGESSAGAGGLALLVAVALAALTVAGLLARRVLRPRPNLAPRSSAPVHDSPSRLRWVLPAIIAALGLAIATPILALVLLRGQSSAGQPNAAADAGTPYLLPEGRKRAPDFTLRDQNGHRFSLAAYRGRPVLVTFVDPLCRNLCPLEAHVLNALVRKLPAAQRPEIVAVSVDVYADTRHNLLEDFGKWSLVPQWRWGIGTQAQLAAIWKRYAIGVQVVNKTLAGTTVHYITHTEASYLIDPAGYERALFAWPFSPQDVLATMRRISRS